MTDAASVTEGIGDPTEIDAVVNNAGFEAWGALELVDDELWTRQLDTNVLGPMRVIRHVLPAWRERGSGTIVNVSSIAGVVGSPFGGAYAASKHALEGLSEALHFETTGFGIRVRLVEPGSFDTDFRANVVTVDGWEGSDYVDASGAVPRGAGRPVGRRHPRRPAGRRRRDRARRTRPRRAVPQLRRRRRPVDPLGQVIDVVRGVRGGHA